MEKITQSCKVISIYSNTNKLGKTRYAINLAVSLFKLTDKKVIFIDATNTSGDIAKLLKLDQALSGEAIINSKIGIDVSTSRHIRKDFLDEIRYNYQYIIIDLPLEINESVYSMLSYSDTVHFFIDSIKDNLKKGNDFLEDLRKRRLIDVSNKLKFIVNRLNIFDKFSIEDMSWLLKRDVWATVPEEGVLDTLIDSNGIPIVLRSKDSLYSKAVLRIAKSEADKLLGLTLGSGGAFGLAHIGVLRVLEQRHIVIDVVSGSSIGALIASMWGLGFPSDKIERIARKLKNKLNIMRLLDFTLPISGILAGRRLKRFLRSILGEKTFEDLQIPVKIMVYDLANRETLVMEKGLLVEAVYKSIAVPGIFEPKVERDRMIVDGGVSDPVPVDVLLKKGVKKIIAVNVLPGPADIYKRNMMLKDKIKEEENLMRTAPFYIKLRLYIKDFFRRIFTPSIFDVIMTSMQSIEYVLAENSCKKADIALYPVFSNASSIDFHLVKDFVRRGEEEASSHIGEIEELALR